MLPVEELSINLSLALMPYNHREPLSGMKKENMRQESRANVRRAWVLVPASLAPFMVGLDALVVATALTTIHQDLASLLGYGRDSFLREPFGTVKPEMLFLCFRVGA
jgi:hypothetical protein